MGGAGLTHVEQLAPAEQPDRVIGVERWSQYDSAVLPEAHSNVILRMPQRSTLNPVHTTKATAMGVKPAQEILVPPVSVPHLRGNTP